MSSPTPAPDLRADNGLGLHLAAVRRRIDAAGRVAASHGRPGAATDPLDASTRLEDVVERLAAGGGKLIRPTVAYLGWRAAGGDPAGDEDLARLGAAIELLHVFGLLQDDVMDEASTRRGLPAAHHALAGALSPRAGAARFGESLAVLAGDLAFALAGRELRGLPAPVLATWDDMVLELVQGQRLDIVYAAQRRFDAADTNWVAMAKSGAYTISRPLRLGALLADPASEPPAWLTAYGRHLGMAFALVDDLLGVWGDPAVTGKPVGDDVRQAKPTTVLGIADALLGGAVTQALAGPGGTDPFVVDRLLRTLDREGVRRAVEDRIALHLTACEEALVLAPDHDVRSALADLAGAIAARTS